MKTTTALLIASACLLTTPALADGLSGAAGKLLSPEASRNDSGTPAPEGASVYFISPADGDTLSSPITVRFGLSGMGVAPAGVNKDHTGHHHLLIDNPEYDATRSLPSSEQIRHFGGGQTEVQLELPAGKHSLQLLLGDFAHRPHQPPVRSKTINITVK